MPDTCFSCGRPAQFVCDECGRVLCDSPGCSRQRMTIHAHGALFALRPITPIPDARVFKTGPLMRAAPPPRAPLQAPPKKRRLDLDSPSSVLEWIEKERGGIPVRVAVSPRRQGRSGPSD